MRRWLMMALAAMMLMLPVGALCESEAEEPEEEVQGNVLSLGDESSEVLSMQTDLARLGYYDGTLSGRFGDLTL